MNRWKILGVILAVSVLLRLSAALYLGDRVENLPGTNDQLSYHALAVRVADGFGFTFGKPWWPATKAGEPTAHWSYLYTFFLAGIYTVFGPHPLIARLVQALFVGLLHPWLVYRIGERVFTPSIGLIAAGLTAVYVYFFYYSAALMTEPFYITAILASLYLMISMVNKENRSTLTGKYKDYQYAIGLGLTLSVAVLLRQLFLLVIPVFFLWILWKGGTSKFLPLVVSGALILIAILPFTIYNQQRFQRFVLLNTNAGYAFFWGNHPIYGDKFIPILPSEIYLSLIPKELLHLDEAALDQALLQRGLQFISNDPARYLKLSISRIPAYFMFWPSKDSGLLSNISRVASFGILLPFMVYGLARAFLSKSTYLHQLDFAQLLLLFAVVYTGIHLLTWALVRYRLPVDAVLILFAALAIADLYAHFIRRSVRT